ncbi:MAG: N-acetylmuramoyl-L-alanine amidase, partial [Vicinamibacteria bacterium]
PFPTPSRDAAPPATPAGPAAAPAPAETAPPATPSAAERADLPLPPAPVPDTPDPADGAAAPLTGAPAPVLTDATAPSTPAAAGAPPRLTAIDRALLPGAVRVTLTLDREVAYREERLGDPDRLFFDLAGVELADDLRDRTLRYGSDVVREIRTGRHPDYSRVVLDVDGVHKHSVFTLYNPFRLVIEAERTDAAAAAATARALPSTSTRPGTTPAVEATPTTTDEGAAPDAPATGGDGKYSIARQLGLGVSRIVIDPGHGGRDPGARAHGVEEAELVLDVSLRLEKLLKQEPGLEVVLTRRTDVFIPLQERTAIANREGADLFLSIHANAARNAQARGIETYYLSFASNPEAEAVAARENAASESAMHNLPDIVKAIALNNKLDESRDLAAMVQESLVTRLRRVNAEVRNLGVKKAPFVVLIGAQMPSVLAEISFLTHRQEAALLKTPTYRQQIAEALYQAILRYRQSLKSTVQTADK